MYTDYTYQDWQRLGATPEVARKIVDGYRDSAFFHDALAADRYFAGFNPTLEDKYLLRIQTTEQKNEDGLTIRRAETVKVPGNRVPSAFLRRFVCQQNQYLLGNGVTLKDTAQKDRLGRAFDVALQQLGEHALVQGVAYGYWNLDHLEPIAAAKDPNSGCVGLLDEMTGNVGAAIQFWRLNSQRPLYMRVFEPDGVTVYRIGTDGEATEEQPKRAYKLNVRRDALGDQVVGAENYSALPLIPLYANDEHQSELTPPIKAKIDLYDKITSDFGDNLDRANDVYWVLNNFGGSTDQALQVVEEIQRLKVALSVSDGAGTSSAEPRTIDVPYAARQTALDLLERALYQDYMALSMSELTGGSLTNVAIQAAMTNLNLKCDHYEWQCFAFVQQVLALLGVDTEEIAFQRQQITNRSETVTDIYAMRADIDQETALKLNPYISQDDIPGILEATEAERVSGMPSLDALQAAIDGQEQASTGKADQLEG